MNQVSEKLLCICLIDLGDAVVARFASKMVSRGRSFYQAQPNLMNQVSEKLLCICLIDLGDEVVARFEKKKRHFICSQ